MTNSLRAHQLTKKPLLQLSKLSHCFPEADSPVFENVDLTIKSGDFVAIVGGSGVGKSTLLRCIADLVKPSKGNVIFSSLPRPGQRQQAVVFQDGRLLPWKTLADNIAFGLEGLGLSAQEQSERVRNVLQLTMLQEFAARWPHQLSGGQVQRGGIARALAVQPDLLLMDEPFSAVDAITRQVLQDEVLHIWHASKAAILFVTHDIHEAVLLADRVLVMAGRPANFTLDMTVNFQRPRQRADMQLFRLVSEISVSI